MIATKIKNSPITSFAVIQLLLAIAFSLTTNEISTLLILAVLACFASSLSELTAVTERLNYDQNDQLRSFSLVLSSIFWGLYFLNDAGSQLSNVTTIFVVLTASSLFLLISQKNKATFCIPIGVCFCIYLLFINEPSHFGLALISIAFLMFFIFLSQEKDKVLTEDSLSESSSNQKLAYQTQIDQLKRKYRDQVEELRSKEVALSSAEMAKMEFLATISHEIRTPLNGIIPLLDILLDSELTSFQKDYLVTAHQSATEMQKLIDDLLDYSKVEAGKLTVETRGLKIAQVIDSVKVSYAAALEKKQLKITTDIDTSINPLLLGDPTRLRQLLSNLVSNSIKFSDSGMIDISARKIKDFPSKQIIRFSVKDQGIGMDGETVENIFKPFNQDDNSSTRKFGGTGLGLSISKKIIELMEGKIGVRSEKNKGSTFYFDLPLLKSAGESQNIQGQSQNREVILVNTNPVLFNKTISEIKSLNIKFHNALGQQQAYEALASLKDSSNNSKNILIILDFESAEKEARSICDDIRNGRFEDNVFVGLICSYSNIDGIPESDNLTITKKDFSIEKLFSKIEVHQASIGADKPTESSKKAKDIKDQSDTSSEIIQSTPTTIKNNDINPNFDISDKLLIVEDNDVNLKVAEKLIQYIGYTFEFARNGLEAVEMVKDKRYRIILMDCQMPVMDGYTSTREIRKFEADSDLNRTPILAMTANAMIGDKEKCLESGMDDYMSKPLNRYLLEKTIKKWDPLAEIKTTKPDTGTAQRTKAAINSKWLSVETLNEVKQYMGAETNDLLKIFETEAPKILKKMHSAVSTFDYVEIGKNAHDLKSSSANVGANGLSFFSRKIELAASSKSDSSIQEIYLKLKKSLALTLLEIKKYKDSQT